MTKNLDDGIALKSQQEDLIKLLDGFFDVWSGNKSEVNKIKFVDDCLDIINVNVKQVLGSSKVNLGASDVPLGFEVTQQMLVSWQHLINTNLKDYLQGQVGVQLDDVEQLKLLDSVQAIMDKVDELLSPLFVQIIEYFNVSVRQGVAKASNIELDESVSEWIEPYLIYNRDYETFHGELKQSILNGEQPPISAVITDPPYYIGMADWDAELPDSGQGNSKENEFKKYLLSVNELLAEDGLIAIFNVKENISLLEALVVKLSQDTNYPNFDYQIMDYFEWVKTNPNHKLDKNYNQRSEYVFVAYRNTQAGRQKYASFNLNNNLYESATLSKPFNNNGNINQTPKPPRMVIRLIQRLTRRQDTILDSYAGSGSIAIAGYSLGRKVYSCELSRYTQLKATNRLEDYKRSIGQQVLREEPWRDLKGFDVNYSEQELIDETFWGYLDTVNDVTKRRKLVNEELISIKDAYRKRYADKQIKAGVNVNTASNHAEYAQYQNNQLTDDELGCLLGFAKVWHTNQFRELFGLDSLDIEMVERIFDPVAVNLATRFRNKYRIERATKDYAETMAENAVALGNAKQANELNQVNKYEHYLLQLMNDLTSFEDEIRNRQNQLSHEQLKPVTGKRLSKEIQNYYRLVGILVLAVNAIEDYRKKLKLSDENEFSDEGALAEFNVMGDIKAIVAENGMLNGGRHQATAMAALTGDLSVFESLLTKDTGNRLKYRGLMAGFSYYDAFIKRHYEGKRPTIIELPALNPLTVIRMVNVHWTDVNAYSLYSLGNGFDEKHHSLATTEDNELVRPIFIKDKAGEKVYLKQTILTLKDKGMRTADIAKKLMITQATVNNLIK
ncbi:site-specific DNA-methyltransferase [Lactiplantibacillus herbarum]|uniref:site-specific DNA-methyltransferase n=1 Tax=Lactiplantibacillus herbarum TaxID=1670446 RepID=UPI00064E9F37|nr:site-specific DNA-methyltransferase [Lactiplantibacillus herbarum]